MPANRVSYEPVADQFQAERGALFYNALTETVQSLPNRKSSRSAGIAWVPGGPLSKPRRKRDEPGVTAGIISVPSERNSSEPSTRATGRGKPAIERTLVYLHRNLDTPIRPQAVVPVASAPHGRHSCLIVYFDVDNVSFGSTSFLMELHSWRRPTRFGILFALLVGTRSDPDRKRIARLCCRIASVAR